MYGLPDVKCEPQSESEEEDSTTLSVHTYFVHQGADSLEDLVLPAPAAPTATPVCVKQESPDAAPAATLEVLEPAATIANSTLDMDQHMTLMSSSEPAVFAPLIAVKDEPVSEGELQQLSGDDTSDSCGAPEGAGSGGKSWTRRDMEHALEALRSHNMSLTKASATFGIPSTTLWQRAHRLGIDTPKKEGSSKSWSEADLRGALHALRAGAISANKASKAYGIPSSTLYKIARREGIRLAAPFNAAPTSWRHSDLERALDSIRCGVNSVQRASTQYGIPTGTLYGRCKREGIELSRSNPTPWSEDAMGEALEAVRVGQMSINQAAIHYNLPYSSLYGRFKRCKYDSQCPQEVHTSMQDCPEMEHHNLQNQEHPSYPQYNQQIMAIPHSVPVQHAEPMLEHTTIIQHPYNIIQPVSVTSHVHDPSMRSNVALHEHGYTGPVIYYSQSHANGIVTS